MEGAEAEAQEASELIPNVHVVRYSVTWSHSQAHLNEPGNEAR